jgi:hypothetical protein
VASVIVLTERHVPLANAMAHMPWHAMQVRMLAVPALRPAVCRCTVKHPAQTRPRSSACVYSLLPHCHGEPHGGERRSRSSGGGARAAAASVLARSGQAGGRGGSHGRGGGHGGSRQLRSGVEEQAGSLQAWLLDAERACSRQDPGAALLISVAKRLERVQERSSNAGHARAMRTLEFLLECAMACRTLRAPPFLGVLTRALTKQPAMLASAQCSPVFMRNARRLLARAAVVEATYAEITHVSQPAVAQCRLHIVVQSFWERLATAALTYSSQGLANVYHAHATLAHQGVNIDKALCAKLERMAPALADIIMMTPQEVANMLWAAAEVRKPAYGSAAVSTPPDRLFMAAVACRAELVARGMMPQNLAMMLSALASLKQALLPSLRAALLCAAQRVAPGMHAQDVANLLWALATLREAMPKRLRWPLLDAAQRVAFEMSSQEVASTLWALATLKEAIPKRLRGLLLYAAQRVAPEMAPQEVANALWALASLGERLSPALKPALLAAAQCTAPTCCYWRCRARCCRWRCCRSL